MTAEIIFNKQEREIIQNEFGNFRWTFRDSNIQAVIDKNNDAKFGFNKFSKQGKSALKKTEELNKKLQKMEDDGFKTILNWAKKGENK